MKLTDILQLLTIWTIGAGIIVYIIKGEIDYQKWTKKTKEGDE